MKGLGKKGQMKFLCSQVQRNAMGKIAYKMTGFMSNCFSLKGLRI